MKILLLTCSLLTQITMEAQNVGIGTTNPLFRLHVEQGNVLFIGPSVLPVAIPGPLPVSGAGTRLMWYPDKAAFRAGYVTDTRWDKDSIGGFSIGAGFNTKAVAQHAIAMGTSASALGNNSVAVGTNNISSGDYALSMGTNTTASGFYSTAFGKDSRAIGFNAIAVGTNNVSSGDYALSMGTSTTASGDFSSSMGTSTTASGDFSTVFGMECNATGVYSTAFGRGCNANGINAIAFGTGCSTAGGFSTSFGRDCTASADNTTAFGQNATASGANSFAMGSYVSTSGLQGSFALGDASTTTVMQSFATNGFRARFAGGYRLFTNSAVTIGAFLNSGANSWAALSDRRMKENFLPVNGEVFLQKIAAMPQFTWNYIGQDVTTFRHYGPMAQDFYQAFGRDGLGEIGCDTLINQQDFLGVSFIAIQALEKRSTEIATENGMLKSKLLLLEDANKKLAEKLLWLTENMDAELKLLKAQLATKTYTSNKVDD